jgi:hypothetical protein
MPRYILYGAVLVGQLWSIPPTWAVLREWDDGGPTKNWSDQFNWFGNIPPDSTDVVEIGTHSAAVDDTVIFDATAATIASLTLVRGADLDTNNDALTVTGKSEIGGPTGGSTPTELIIRPSFILGQPNAFATGTLTMDRGRLTMHGGRVSVRGSGAADGVLSTTMAGSIRGYGVINLDDADISEPSAALLVNEGFITVEDPDDDGTGEPPARTLQINKPAALSWAEFELNGSITIRRNSTLDINQGAQSIGSFAVREPRITMFANSRFDRDFTTHLGTLFVLSGAVTVGETTLPAVPAVISGGPIVQNRLDGQCSITLLSSDAELIFESSYGGITGTIDNAGTVRFAGDAEIGPAITILPSGGTLVNETGSTLTLRDDAIVDLPLQQWGVLELGRHLAPDHHLGQANVRNFTQHSPGELVIDVGGILADDFDAMAVQGNAVLDGTLSVELVNSFMPVLGNSFTIIQTTVGNVAGSFDQEILPAFGGLTFDVIYNPQSVVLQVVEDGLAGDYNDDGAVNAADYVAWRDNEGTMNMLPNDAIGGVIGLAHYDQWRGHFGQTAGTGSLLHGHVPEPESLATLFAALLAMLCCRRAAVYWTRALDARVGAVLILLTTSHVGSPPFAAAQGITEVIALSGDAAPDGNGTFSTFNFATNLNNAGQVAFAGVLTDTVGGTSDDLGIYLGDGGPLTQIARDHPAGLFNSGLSIVAETSLNDSGQVTFRGTFQQSSVGGAGLFDGVFRGSGGPLTTVALEGAAAPDGNGAYLTFQSSIGLNASGQTAFIGFLRDTIFGANDDSGVYLGAGGPITQIAHERQAAPDLNGTFSFFEPPALNVSGEVAFRAVLTATSGGTEDNMGIFLGSGGTLTQIVRTGQAAPDGNGTLSDLGLPALNDSRQVAFFANLTDTSGGFSDDAVMLLSAGGQLTQIAHAGQTAPDGNGILCCFTMSPSLNAAGQVAFVAHLSQTSGGMTDDSGLFFVFDGSVLQIAREGQPAPDGNGTYSGVGSPALNDSGQMAFYATFAGTSGGTSDDAGIYLANGIDILQLAREGDALAGSTINGLAINNSGGPAGDERSSINNSGQVAYWAKLANGDEAIVLFTIPDVHWDLPNSGNWSTAVNWSPTIVPNSFHNTFIDPDENLTVTGSSSNSVVKSLTVGATGSGQAVLELTGGGDLEALESITINTRGWIEVSTGHVLTAPTLINSGVLIGDGQVDANVVNLSGGQVRARPGDSLEINASTAHSSAGTIEALIAAEIEFNGPLTNVAPTGQILGTNASFRFNDGLTNEGVVSLNLAGNVFGNLTNTASGTITVENNGGETTFEAFHDNVTNGGSLDVTAGSTAVFLRELSGNGNVGSGEVRALGDLVPGTSAGLMTFGGDLTFGPLTFVRIEIGGLSPGSQHDQLQVAGDALLDGQLRAETIDGFNPAPGQQFTVLTAANVVDNGLMLVGPLAGSLQMIVDESTVILLALSGLAGDYNNNGIVDAADYVVWRKNVGSPPGTLLNDVDGGIIAQAQYATWKANFGEFTGGGPSAGANATVPEPSTIVLLMHSFAVSLFAWRGRAG